MMPMDWTAPLRFGSTGLPVRALLAATLVALGLLASGGLFPLPVAFGSWWALTAVVAALIAKLVLNRGVRSAAGLDIRTGRAGIWICWGAALAAIARLTISGGRIDPWFWVVVGGALLGADWPRRPLIVFYDGDCAFCLRAMRWFKRVDLEGMLDWRPLQSGAGVEFGLSESVLRERLHLVDGARIRTGFHAFQIMLLCNPLFHLAAAGMMAGAPAGWPRLTVAGLLASFFFPLFRPLGEALYDVVARNRGKLVAFLPPRG